MFSRTNSFLFAQTLLSTSRTKDTLDLYLLLGDIRNVLVAGECVVGRKVVGYIGVGTLLCVSRVDGVSGGVGCVVWMYIHTSKFTI